ncbi:MAG: hypothetical protein DRI90_20915 [Deltaproteobacteria bacterium]|nr:MAG: hypothetical protein DRI90_20915 [Deltaproteobacteria bacterium]
MAMALFRAWPDGPAGKGLALVVLTAGSLGWACGGKAVVDEMISGAGGASSSSSSGSVGGSPLCATPDPVGALVPCGGSSSGGAGSPIGCTTILCDQDDNRWESECSTTGCRCNYNGILQCSCVNQGSVPLCVGSTPACCPAPFPN